MTIIVVVTVEGIFLLNLLFDYMGNECQQIQRALFSTIQLRIIIEDITERTGF